MPLVGKRYYGPHGAEVIVTRGESGVLSDGIHPLQLKDSPPRWPRLPPPAGSVPLRTGARFRSPDQQVKVLVNRPGPCDLRYNGEPMEPTGGADSAGTPVPRRPSPGGASTAAAEHLRPNRHG